MKASSRLIAIATALAGLAGMAAAQETGGVRITGEVTKATSVGRSTNVAAGEGARAITNVGTISGGVTVRGDLDMVVHVDEVDTIANGPGERAETRIGTIEEGTVITGRREVVVKTGKVVNMSDGPGRPGCVAIAATGLGAGC